MPNRPKSGLVSIIAAHLLPVAFFPFFLFFFLLIVCQARIGRQSHRKVRAIFVRSILVHNSVVECSFKFCCRERNGYTIHVLCHSMITKHRVEYDKPPPPANYNHRLGQPLFSRQNNAHRTYFVRDHATPITKVIRINNDTSVTGV